MKCFIVIFVWAFSMRAVVAQLAPDYQRLAVEKYPALGQADSAFHAKFLALYSAAKAQNAPFLVYANWPMVLADATAKSFVYTNAVVPSVTDCRAFDTINFGDTKQIVQQKLRQSTKLKPMIENSIMFDKGYINGEYILMIGEEAYKAYFEFVDDQLATISFYGFSRNASFYDTLVKRDWESVREVAITRFGQPTRSNDYPQFFEMKNGFSIRTDVWTLDNKEVCLGIGEDNSTYYASLDISDTELSAKQKSRDETKKQQSQKAAADGF